MWRPGTGLAGMRDDMAQIRDKPGNPGRVATLLPVPMSVRDPSLTLTQFCARLKTVLFCRAYETLA